MSRVWKAWAGLLIAATTILAASCGGEPTPPRLVYFSPAVLLVPTDETVAVRVVYERNDATTGSALPLPMAKGNRRVRYH